MPMRRRSIEDRACGVVLELGLDGGDSVEARVSWRDGSSDLPEPNRSCWVESSALTIGRWIQTREGDDPPIAVVCRATALAVGVRIKQDVLAALEGLP